MIALSYKFPSIFPFVKGYNCSGSDNNRLHSKECWGKDPGLDSQQSQARADLAQLYTYGVVLRWVPGLQYLLDFLTRNVFSGCEKNILTTSFPGSQRLCFFFGGFYKWENIDFDRILGL